MPASRQISIRIRSETHAWLERQAGGSRNKAGFLRRLIEREMAREKQQELLTMFNEASGDLTDEDREERDSLLGGFAAGE
ncbi:MAG: hypothetical protein GY856_31915 [bacterium]|nr:hypothetical protein [bacterium]